MVSGVTELFFTKVLNSGMLLCTKNSPCLKVTFILSSNTFEKSCSSCWIKRTEASIEQPETWLNSVSTAKIIKRRYFRMKEAFKEVLWAVHCYTNTASLSSRAGISHSLKGVSDG